MRVLFISGLYPPSRSGVADYLEHLVGALNSRGVEAHVLTSANGPPDQENVHKTISNWGPSCAATVRSVVIRLQPQIVHIQYPSWFNADRTMTVHLLPLVMRWSVRGLPVVVTMHEAARVRRRWLLRPLVTAALSDVITTPSEPDRAVLRQFLPRKRIETIPVGASILPAADEGLQERWTLRNELGVAEDEILIIHFGAVRATSGIDSLLRAFSKARAERWRVRLLLVSDLEPESDRDYVTKRDANRVKQLIREFGADGLIVRGYAKPNVMSRLLSASDMAVYPYTGGVTRQRTALLACLAHGLPVITTDAGDAPHDYVDGVNMLLVPVEDQLKLEDAVRRLATDVALRQRLSEGAFELAKTFSWSSIAEQTEALYRTLL